MKQIDFLEMTIQPDADGVTIEQGGDQVYIPYMQIQGVIDALSASLPHICRAYAHQLAESDCRGG